MIRMYPDGVVEGSPEEVAAFKHIDAALTLRNAPPRQRALTAVKSAKKAAPKKVKSSRVRSSRATTDTHARQWAKENGITVASRGRVPYDVMDAYERARQTGEFIESTG